jgi:hypothetical protein
VAGVPAICVAGIEAYEIQANRMQNRLKPMENQMDKKSEFTRKDAFNILWALASRLARSISGSSRRRGRIGIGEADLDAFL